MASSTNATNGYLDFQFVGCWNSNPQILNNIFFPISYLLPQSSAVNLQACLDGCASFGFNSCAYGGKDNTTATNPVCIAPGNTTAGTMSVFSQFGNVDAGACSNTCSSSGVVRANGCGGPNMLFSVYQRYQSNIVAVGVPPILNVSNAPTTPITTTATTTSAVSNTAPTSSSTSSSTASGGALNLSTTSGVAIVAFLSCVGGIILLGLLFVAIRTMSRRAEKRAYTRQRF